jgi:hypothetical protein
MGLGVGQTVGSREGAELRRDQGAGVSLATGVGGWVAPGSEDGGGVGGCVLGAADGAVEG